MKIKIITHFVLYLMSRLPWRRLTDVIIDALNQLPPIRRELVIRELVAVNKLGHVQRNPRRPRNVG